MRRSLRVRAAASRVLASLGLAVLILSSRTSLLSAESPKPDYSTHAQPFLTEFCSDCHADGAKKGGIAFDGFTSEEERLRNKDFWLRALNNLRSGIMPPPKKPQPDAAAKARFETWVKSAVFQLDPQNADPGRITVRRLNRAEYKNTIRDLLGIEFDTTKAFPPDDSSHGFDNIGDALTLPPMLLEKYFAAARTIIQSAVPETNAVPAETVYPAKGFLPPPTGKSSNTSPTGNDRADARALSYYEHTSLSNRIPVSVSGHYQLALEFNASERYVDNVFDYNQCRVRFRLNGELLHEGTYARESAKAFRFEFERTLPKGDHTVELEVEPITPDQKQIRSLTIRFDGLTLRGPLEHEHWIEPARYSRFFPKTIPSDSNGRQLLARDLLQRFAAKAYRRPPEPQTVERLVAIAERAYTQPSTSFEQGIRQGMIAVLASPRFLFREEASLPPSGPGIHPLIDEFALASRMSYFLWSTMPDDELLNLARENKLRTQLRPQIARMIRDDRFGEFIRNFAGQWLQIRDLDSIQIDARQVLSREAPVDPEMDKRRVRFQVLKKSEERGLSAEEKVEIEELRNVLFRRNQGPPRAELTTDLRKALRTETEQTLQYVLREGRPLLELIDSDYTFLNERLAKHYALTNLSVTGETFQKVSLPAGSPRGGLLTQGSVLTVTSNPTRTSPVKRGLFVLFNLLGTPPPPPPPDVPPLEDAAKAMKDKNLSLRETLALHREQPQCSSCHNRMDPLGLALENFNAMGMWRDQDRGQPLDTHGALLTGESFNTVQELKQLLTRTQSTQIYRTLTEKMLTYALGRGLEYYDITTIDTLVARLEQSNGNANELLTGILESAPFQRTRAQVMKKSTIPKPTATSGN